MEIVALVVGGLSMAIGVVNISFGIQRRVQIARLDTQVTHIESELERRGRLMQSVIARTWSSQAVREDEAEAI